MPSSVHGVPAGDFVSAGQPVPAKQISATSHSPVDDRHTEPTPAVGLQLPVHVQAPTLLHCSPIEQALPSSQPLPEPTAWQLNLQHPPLPAKKHAFPVVQVQCPKPSAPVAHTLVPHWELVVHRQWPLTQLPPSLQSTLVEQNWPSGLSLNLGPPGSHSSPPSTMPSPQFVDAPAAEANARCTNVSMAPKIIDLTIQPK